MLLLQRIGCITCMVFRRYTSIIITYIYLTGAVVVAAHWMYHLHGQRQRLQAISFNWNTTLSDNPTICYNSKAFCITCALKTRYFTFTSKLWSRTFSEITQIPVFHFAVDRRELCQSEVSIGNWGVDRGPARANEGFWGQPPGIHSETPLMYPLTRVKRVIWAAENPP